MKYYYSVVLSEQLFQNFNFISNCNISYFLYFMVFPSTNIFYQIFGSFISYWIIHVFRGMEWLIGLLLVRERRVLLPRESRSVFQKSELSWTCSFTCTCTFQMSHRKRLSRSISSGASLTKWYLGDLRLQFQKKIFLLVEYKTVLSCLC